MAVLWTILDILSKFLLPFATVAAVVWLNRVMESLGDDNEQKARDLDV